jgi:hypothetical protein
MSASDIQIAGLKTCADWNTFRKHLVPGQDAARWRQAVENYFHQKLSSRYLDPIKMLQDQGTYHGEGFSIVAIQCTLIEFFESTVQGVSYRYLSKGRQLGPYEYFASGHLFVNFLSKRHPFSQSFSEDLARDFYVGIRCGLLHEAQTKSGWTVWGNDPSDTVIDVSQGTKVLYRDNFQAALLEFVRWYEHTLPTDVAIQEAFIRKFDSLYR